MPTRDANGRGVELELVVDITEVDRWNEKLSVGVGFDFEPTTPGTKTSRIAKRKPISRINTIIDLFF